jgi:hypothetical protein
MSARNTQPVRYLVDDTAVPPKRQEVVTRSEHALAFWLGGAYSRPDHHFDALLTGTWAVIRHHAPADAVPVFVHYERADAPGGKFRVGDQRFAYLGEAMEAAATDLAAVAALLDPDPWAAQADEADDPDEHRDCAICQPGECPGPDCPGSLRPR